MGLKKIRVQILLKPEQHNTLVEIARTQNRSLSGLTREILSQWLEQFDIRQRWEQHKNALEQLEQIRQDIQQKHGILTKDLLEEARAERDEDMDRVWRGEA